MSIESSTFENVTTDVNFLTASKESSIKRARQKHIPKITSSLQNVLENSSQKGPASQKPVETRYNGERKLHKIKSS
jgi:hypothetical protein